MGPARPRSWWRAGQGTLDTSGRARAPGIPGDSGGGEVTAAEQQLAARAGPDARVKTLTELPGIGPARERGLGLQWEPSQT